MTVYLCIGALIIDNTIKPCATGHTLGFRELGTYKTQYLSCAFSSVVPQQLCKMQFFSNSDEAEIVAMVQLQYPDVEEKILQALLLDAKSRLDDLGAILMTKLSKFHHRSSCPFN